MTDGPAWVCGCTCGGQTIDVASAHFVLVDLQPLRRSVAGKRDETRLPDAVEVEDGQASLDPDCLLDLPQVMQSSVWEEVLRGEQARSEH